MGSWYDKVFALIDKANNLWEVKPKGITTGGSYLPFKVVDDGTGKGKAVVTLE